MISTDFMFFSITFCIQSIKFTWICSQFCSVWFCIIVFYLFTWIRLTHDVTLVSGVQHRDPISPSLCCSQFFNKFKDDTIGFLSSKLGICDLSLLLLKCSKASFQILRKLHIEGLSTFCVSFVPLVDVRSPLPSLRKSILELLTHPTLQVSNSLIVGRHSHDT